MEIEKALSLSLGELEEPVVTRYRLGLIVADLYMKKSFHGESLNRIRKEHASSSEFNKSLLSLEDAGILKPHPDLKHAAFRLLGRKDEDPADVVCTVDPFCYVSHLSAMAHHGLTNRIPAKLFLSSPPAKEWNAEAEERMEKDLGTGIADYVEGGMPALLRVAMKKINGVEISRFASMHRGAFKNTRGRMLRVSTIGRTFLDMLRNPELCGGMRHVVEVYEEHAATYLRLISDEVDRHGKPIDKVRAGYLLSEKQGLKNDTVESWVAFAQRGGSRKLNASGEYAPVFSDKWCLSLNLD